MALLISDAQVSSIAESLGVGTDSEYVASVLDVLRAYSGRQIAMSELPPGDHRTRDIETLLALARAMDGVNANVLHKLSLYGADLLGDPPHIAMAARAAAEEMQRTAPPSRFGPRPLTSRAIALRQLAYIYRQATGRRATITARPDADGIPSGPFFAFLRAAVAPVSDLHGLNDDGLASAHRRALKVQKKRQG